jgi:hypothetical protein
MASKKRRQYADRELARSVERVVVGGEKAAAVSREANIPYRTLAKYVRRARAGESITRRRTGPPPMLTADGERRLLVWMRALQQQGLPVRRRELMDKANGLLRENATAANEQLSAGWYKRFRQRHPEVTGSSTDLAVDSEPPVSGTAASSVTSEAVDSDQPVTRLDGETASSGDADVSSASKDPVAAVVLSPRQMENLSPTERAVLVLQDQYAAKMSARDVVEAFDVMLDPLKARVFLVMSAGVGRDLWLRNQVAKARE